MYTLLSARQIGLILDALQIAITLKRNMGEDGEATAFEQVADEITFQTGCA